MALTPLRCSTQKLNPLPFALIAANCVGWTVYGCITSDYFVFIGNFPGFLMGLFFVSSSMQYATQKVGKKLRLAPQGTARR
jgi:hypothetical protein